MVQTVAKELNVPKEIISMKPVNSFVSPQNSPSWGSFTTDCMCSSAIVACQSLKERLKEVEDTMDHPTWIELIKECHKRNIDLTVRHQYDFNDRNQKLIITDCFLSEDLAPMNWRIQIMKSIQQLFQKLSWTFLLEKFV